MKTLLVMIAGFGWLVGCAKYTARPLDAGRAASAFGQRSLNDAGLQQFLASQGAARGAWNVDRLALAAAYFHGDVAVARAEADEAAAGIKTAGQVPDPVLSFSPAYNATTKGISPWIITPSLDVTIETAGKRAKRLAQARASAEAARLRVAAAAWEVRTKVRTAMLDLHVARENIGLLQAEGALHEEALNRLDAQVKAGESPAFELTQARLDSNRSRLALHDAEKQAAVAQAQLAAAIGVSSAAVDAVTLDFAAFDSLPVAPGTNIRRQALVNRADLLAALADYAGADAELRLEIAKQYPDVHLNPGYELDQTDNKWSLGLSVELPILNQNRGPIAQAEARRKTAGAKFEAKQAAVFGEIETAAAAYRAARAKAATAAQLASDAKRASDSTKGMVEAGELATIELVRRRIEASATALSQAEARQQAQQAVGALEAALHIPLRR